MTTDTGAITTYAYDPVNRLTSAITGAITETWSYDANANRTVATKTGTATAYSAFNAADQLCWTGASTGTCATPPTGATGYVYDANGNTTTAGATTSVWNTFDQLTSYTSGTTTNFTYAGPRNDERSAAGATAFMNGSLGITQQTTGGATTSFIRDPGGTLISMRTSSGASYYYTSDALGSTILVTDSTQAAAASYAYDSWGKTTATGAQAAVNPWQYAGGYKDTATGYTKFGARYYDATIGRFTQADPSGQSTNRYAYVGCSPVNATDPSGLLSRGCIGSAILVGVTFGLFITAAIGASVATGGLAGVAIVTAGLSFGGIVGSGFLAADTCGP
jgi:RHS repeat-associated protein